MGRLRFGQCASLVAVIFFLFPLLLLLSACGGSKPPGPSPFPAKIILNPSPSYSLQVGTTFVLSASAINSANAGLRPAFTFAISPISPAGTSPAGVLDIAPNGFVCAGTWNAPAYTICTPGNTGTVAVTASALGATSAPTLIFVHGPIDNIQVSVIPPVNSPPPACPSQQALPPTCNIPFNANVCQPNKPCACLSQNQVQTLQATAYSQGVDITATVGPFSWTQGTAGVGTITPIVNPTFNVATNQATASPGTPGQTQVIASASGVYSQPYYFETCPVQCIALQLSVNGQYTDQTSFVVSKGTSETITATAVDIQGCMVPKPALTWVSSQPAALAPGNGTACAGTTCTISTTQPGAAAITASCTPPTCNVGFPLNPANLSAPFIPQPVYPVTAISGLVTGAPVATSVLATSQDCYSDPSCGVALYSVSTANNLPGHASELPTPPNSLLFDPPGDQAFMGSEFGALAISPGNLTAGGANPFTFLTAPGTPRGVVTGKLLAVSQNGHIAIFSDTVSTPNQVYVVTAGPSSTTALNINGAVAAAVSRDGLKAFILGDGGNTLYIYSPLQTLQPPISLPSPATSIVFNSTGSFALFSGGSPAGNLAVYRTCDSSLVTPYLSAPGILTPPLFLKMVPAGEIPQGNPLGNTFGGILIPNLEPAGLDFFFGLDSTGIDIIATNSSQDSSFATLCPQNVTLAQTTASAPFPPVHININQGTFHPINFFLSPDATRAYIVTSDFGVLVYDFNTNSVSNKIGLINDATPLAADITVDGTLIYVAGSDGLLHQLNTTLGVDFYQTSFTPLPDSTNAFCFTGQDCHLNLVVVKP